MDGENTEEILKKIGEVGTAVKAAQDKAEDAFKKAGRLDSLDENVIKQASEVATKAMEGLQSIKLAYEADKKATDLAIAQLTAELTKPGNAKGAEEAEAKADGAYGSGFSRYLRKGNAMSEEVMKPIAEAIVKKHLSGLEEKEFDHEVKTLLSGSNPDGGYFVRPTVSANIIKRIFETSPIRNYANIETTTSDQHEMLIDDDQATSGGWVGEQQARGNTNTPQVGKVQIPIHEQFANPQASQKNLDDAGFNVETWLQNKVQDILSRKENTAFVTGSGVLQPVGFLTLPAWASAGVYQRNALEQFTTGVSGQFTADAIKLLQIGLKEAYQARAIFLIKRQSFGGIVTLKDGQGRYLLNPENIREANMLNQRLLLGNQVVFADDMPAQAGAALAMAYGDFSVGYTIVDRMGIRVIRDNMTNKPNVQFYTTKRVGGAVTNYEAIKILKLS